MICRACENGSIWRLATPGTDLESGKISNEDKDKLIYGNILDAFGTEVFGDISNKKAVEKIEKLIRLSKKKIAGFINTEEEIELSSLRKIFQTDDKIEF